MWSILLYQHTNLRYTKEKKGILIYLTSKERRNTMNLAKVSSNGQITIPQEVRQELGLKPGDKVLFLTNERGEMTIRNASLQAVTKAQDAFVNVAEELAIYDEEDVQKLVDEVRYKK